MPQESSPAGDAAGVKESGNFQRLQANGGIPLGTRAMALPPRDSGVEDEDSQENGNIKQPVKDGQTNEFPPPPPPALETALDNVSLAASEVTLRHPNIARPPGGGDSRRNNTQTLKHSSSTSDLIKLRNQNGRLKESKSMILPISAPRSPLHISHSNTHSFDGSSLTDRLYGSANPVSPATFSPYVPGPGTPGGGYPQVTFVYPAADSQSGHFPGGSSSVSSHHHHKMPTPPEVKTKVFTDMLTISLSTIYAVLVVTLGVSFYVVDYIQMDNEEVNFLAEGFSLSLLSIALLYLLYLCIDISVYNQRKKTFDKIMENMDIDKLEMRETTQGVQYDKSLHDAMALNKKLNHKYCFNLDRHSSNFYLKIGAAVFCFGHLIHSVLVLTYRGIVMGTEVQTSTDCLSLTTLIIEFLYPIYSIVLLFFIFKYSNVIINKNRDFHRFGFMHCLASSVCFWLWTIFRETAEYIQNYPGGDYDSSNGTEEGVTQLPDTEAPLQGRSVITPFRFTGVCEHDELNVIYQSYSPYLYPFSVEYCILVVGILYIVWINIGLCAPKPLDHGDHAHGEDTRECRNERRPSEPESNITIHADCHASNKGLFFGFIVLVFSIVSLILFFVTYNSETEGLPDTGLAVNHLTRMVIMIMMIIAVVCAYFQMIQLDVNEVAHNSLDNFLCLMCLPAFFVFGIFSTIPGIVYGHVLAVVSVLTEVVQVVIQTTFIIDGMSRSSNTKQLRKKKPGREFVIFLVICNVAMWIMQTFEVKSHGMDQYRQEFYSRELWSIIGHSCLPLMMFYRFHSSVCIVDIWKYAYVPSGH